MTAATTPADKSAPRGHVQVPRSLLYSDHHRALAVWAWATYETLMPHGLGGGRAPVIARRCFLTERAGMSTTALDDARRELLASTPGGPYLSRSAPRGAKRSVKHAALRLPRQTSEPYAPVPSWTLDVVWAGRRRPNGRVSPDAWRLYAACVDCACRPDAPGAFDTTVSRLGGLLRASTATGRRRLAELEAAGLVEVSERAGGWLSVRPILDACEVADVARAYAERGRQRVEPRPNPSHIAALTPANKRHSPLADSGTPLESPTRNTASQEAPSLPAEGETTRRSTAPTAEKPNRSSDRQALRGRVRAAAEVYRMLPAELAERISEHGSQRILRALAAELEHRSPAELAERIARNWEYWRYRLCLSEPVRDPVALTIWLVRRGLDCVDVRCEDGHQLDLDAPCKACALAAVERTPTRPPAPDRPDIQPVRSRSSRGIRLRRRRASGADHEAFTGATRDSPATVAAAIAPVDVHAHAARARALLKAPDCRPNASSPRHPQTHARSA